MSGFYQFPCQRHAVVRLHRATAAVSKYRMKYRMGSRNKTGTSAENMLYVDNQGSPGLAGPANV